MPTKSNPPAAGQAAHTEHSAFLLGISEAHSVFGMTFDDDSQSPRSLAYDYGRNVGEALADLTDAQLPEKPRAFVLHALNTSAANEARIAELESLHAATLRQAKADLETLKQQDARIAALESALKHIKITASFSDGNPEMNRDRLASILQDARAALALAKGGAS